MDRRTEQDVDRLFGLPPEEFIGARDELSKRLKEEGRGQEASEVRSLRRPTVAAWAVNQTARQHPEHVKELLAAGAALRQAQRKVLSGVKAGGFRDAVDRRRRAVIGLTKSAEEILRASGHSSAGATEAVGSTFEAASLDEGAAELVRAGRLTKDLPAPADFGAGGLAVVEGGPAEEEAPTRAGARREADAAREARELATKAAQARRRAIKAREAADRPEAKLEKLRTEAEEVRQQGREAAREAREAEAEAARAQAEADRAARRAQA